MNRSFYIIVMMSMLLWAFQATGQQKELKFKNFTQEDGLPSNETYAVFRDSRNYIWIATDQGVVRYNGMRMEHFSLPDNVVFKIREDVHGRIWFFSHTGKLSYFFNEKIYPYQFNDSIAKHIKGLLITDAYVAPDGGIWLNSAEARYKDYNISAKGEIKNLSYFRSLESHDTSRIKIYRTDANTFFARRLAYSVIINSVNIILEGNKQEPERKYRTETTKESYNHLGCISSNGYIYLFAGKLLARLDPDGSIISKIFPADILCIQASGKNIWVGTIKNGACMLDKDLKSLDTPNFLDGLSISSVAIDHEGGTWFSTVERGVFYLKNILVYNLQGSSELMQPVSRMYNVGDSALLFTNEHGLYKVIDNKVTNLFLIKSDNVSDIFLGLKRRLYMACKLTTLDMEYNAKKIRIHDKLADTMILVNSSAELKLTKDDNLYNLCGHLLQLFELNKPGDRGKMNFKPVLNKTTSINGNMFFFDSEGLGWFGTTGMLYNIDEKFALKPFKPSSPLFQKGITNMRQMNNGWYIIGLRFGGIVIMKDTTIIANITEADGLLNNSIKYLLPQGDRLWAATAKGISVIHFQSYQPLSYTIRNIGKNEGFSNIVIKQLMPYQGNILAATGNGIYVIENPTQFLDKKEPEIPLYINSINYYKGDTSGISSIIVPYNRNRLKIGLSAISFNSPEEVKYYYRFDKIDTAWQEIAGSELLLENLPPNNYGLELRAGIPNQQRFSQIKKFSITIEAPWWKNVWLNVGALLVLLTGVFILYKTRIRSITKKANLRTLQKTKMLELEQTALRSQMNPHFIFNILTSIQQLIVSKQADKANDYLVKFARLMRKTLELSARPYIPIEEEKNYLDEYLVLEQLRIPGEFEFIFDIDGQIDIQRTEIPNMMLQPIVENCIRHGIKHLQKKKGLITISMKLTGTVICCTITDNGIGRNNTENPHDVLFTKQKSYGMDIVRKRLELLPGAEERVPLIEITDLQNTHGPAGTRVSIQLPYRIINS